MPEGLFDRQRAALGELWRLVEARRTGEEELAFTFNRDEKLAVAAGETARKELEETQQRELAELDAAMRKEKADLNRRLTAEETAAQQALADKLQSLEDEERGAREKIEQELKEALWLAESVSDEGRRQLQQEVDMARRTVAVGKDHGEQLWQGVELVLARVGMEREDVEPDDKVPKAKGDTLADHAALLSRADDLLVKMQQLGVLRWMGWPTTITFGLIAMAAGAAPALWMHPLYLWLLGGVGVGFLVAAGTRELLRLIARRRLRPLGHKIGVLLEQAEHLAADLVRQTEARTASQRTAIHNKYIAERLKAQEIHRPRIEYLQRRIFSERVALERAFEARTPGRQENAKKTQEKARLRHEEARARCLARQEKERRDTEAAQAQRMRKLDQTRIERSRHLRQLWEAGAGPLLATFTELRRIGEARRQEAGNRDQEKGVRSQGNRSLTPDPCLLTPELPFGTLTVDVAHLGGEMPVKNLEPFPSTPLKVPAFLPFPGHGGLLLQAFGQGRAVAVQILQALMLRFLTSLPPGKVRFTILDPVGLGDNFAAFMHLADHDENLVTSRIWTEPGQIEKQLVDITAHMENVIQKYLRSEFSSIEDYNAQAGEVAEPYRILVVANFPVNFTPQAARRLVSLVQSGSSCGVYALIGLDTRQPLPQEFQIEDLEQQCFNLYWRQERFQCGDVVLDRYPLELEMPPEANEVVETVRRIGERSRDANRVRVPFSFIAPTADQVWKGDSRRGLAVPLGRTGATRRLMLQLGQGTSQHVLVAGKTGSGKSTLWHTLIANLALMYSPDEVELYLIDFKKGVEFKPYAVHHLPHARVIAVESEREFGLSVLQRLDAELRQRGDLFRSAGVNDLAGYRQARPDSRCPRILFIVDEFQEFFVEDDRLSQEAALLLDRLVRQGRAFGLHVLLGSQTLGGAYSLARSTIDQMAVRIALQCSEADARLILDKDNGAARLLSRPGEAIYNDSNGALEGNEIFQVVWLPEEEREKILINLHERVTRQMPEAARRLPLVFEGDTPSELDHNPVLLGLLEQGPGAPRPGGWRAWLGEPVAIKDPTAALFRSSSGSNLLIVGQNDEAALAMLISSLVSLAVQQPSARFLLLDGADPHDPAAAYVKSVAESWPGSLTLVERTGLTAALAGLATEMNERLKSPSGDRGEHYVLINGLQRYREFRRADDDMGFGRRGAERTVSPLEHLQSLLRDGPAVGIHLLIWCDSLANVMRSLDRPGLRECGQRVLFQMSAADSSHLLDTPIASRLGRNRALFFTDEMAQPEKFRPYGLPALAWVMEVKKRLARPLQIS